MHHRKTDQPQRGYLTGDYVGGYPQPLYEIGGGGGHLTSDMALVTVTPTQKSCCCKTVRELAEILSHVEGAK